MNAHHHPTPVPQVHQPLILLISGPAGSGKDTLGRRLVEHDPEFEKVVTATTRPPRPGEVDGVHYHFMTPTAFGQEIATGNFLEWAYVHGSGNRLRMYGTPKQSLFGPLSRGRSVVLDIDVQGAANVRKAASQDPAIRRALVTVFIRGQREILKARMENRGDPADEIERRLITGVAEMFEAEKFNFIIDSDTRDHDFAKLLDIIEVARARLNVAPAVA